MKYKLRDYQEDLISQTRSAYNNSPETPKIVVTAPTRSGKTIIFASMAKKIQDNNKKVWILTHRQEIFDQTFEKLVDFGISPGQIRSDKNLSKNNVQVAMIQTLYNVLKKQERIKKDYKFNKFEIVEKPDLIIIDECHHSKSKTWQDTLTYYDDVPLIGFTATPERLDGKGLCDIFDALVIGNDTQWMIDNYWLSKPIHLCPPSPLDKVNLKKIMGDYDKKSQAEIMKKHIVCANVVKSYREFFNGAPVIVFCVTIDHCEQMEKAYREDGWNPVVLSSKMKKKERRDAVSGLREGKYNQLISCEVVSEGFDVPAVYGVQLLRKTASLALYLQMSARGLTPIYSEKYPNIEDINVRKKAIKEGKPESIILDHAGNYWLHGSITKKRDWSIDHKTRKIKKNTIEKLTCPKCFYSWEFNVKKCPHCGHSFEKEKAEAKLFEMHELKDRLIDIADLKNNEADNLSKVIMRIKDYDNKNKAMIAIMHNSIRHQELNLQNKLKGMCEGLGYDRKYHYRVWQHLKKTYGDKLDRLA